MVLFEYTSSQVSKIRIGREIEVISHEMRVSFCAMTTLMVEDLANGPSSHFYAI